jgi:hypothetical protein
VTVGAQPAHLRSTGLVDVLDRVLDKGLVVAGDIKISVAEVELITIRIRLLVCSLDKAEQIGLDWWRYDRYFSPGLTEPRFDAGRSGRRIESAARGARVPKARSSARTSRRTRKTTREASARTSRLRGNRG